MNKPHEPNRLTDYLDLTPEAVDAIKREAESEERQEPGGAAENVGEREAKVIIVQSSVPEMETARTEAEIIETFRGLQLILCASSRFAFRRRQRMERALIGRSCVGSGPNRPHSIGRT